MIFKSNVFDLNFNNSVGYLTFRAFDNIHFIKHGFSTRTGGVSKGCFTSMNLGFSTGDTRKNVLENYRLFCNALKIKPESLVASSQDHSTYIRIVSQKDKGIGIYREKDILSVDGLLTNEKGISLITYYADCVPLFFIDDLKKVIGLAHAGWRGTQQLIAEKMITKMQIVYNSSPKDILVGIGPSIGKCCYEVDLPIVEKFRSVEKFDCEKIITNKNNNKFTLNLQEANKQVLMKNGVKEKNIYVTDLCTKCFSDLLISHRATNGKRGTMAAVLQLKE